MEARRNRQQTGFSLIEVMIAMVILAFAILGVMGSFRWAEHGLRQGSAGMRALALVEARLEAKRAALWMALLTDDVDGDGKPDVTMRDDGQPPDARAGDGLYTAEVEQDGIVLRWTVQADRPGPMPSWGAAIITASARYPVGEGRWREATVGTLRANPFYLGAR